MPEIADADEVGDGWMRESLADAARREREYVAWEAAHGAERDEQLASIANADFYWALPHEIGRRPRWQLREAKHRAQDGICTVGRNELDVEAEPWPDTPTLAPDMIPTAARQSRQPRHPTAPTVARQPPTANNIFLDRHHVRALSRTPQQLPDSPDSPDRPDTR